MQKLPETRRTPGLKTGLLTTLFASLLTTFALAAEIPFTAPEQAAMKVYQQHFRAIGNQAQLLASFHEADKLKHVLASRLDKYMEALQKQDSYPSEADLKALGARTPGLAPSMVAEGTALVLAFDYAAYAKAAAKTPEPSDDAFFTLMQKAYGPVDGYWGNWFNQTWDYGGCTWLGKGVHTALLREIQKQRQTAFAADLKPLEAQLLRDLEQSNKFCLPRPQVVQEFQQLLPLLPSAIRPRLQKRLQQLQTDKNLKEFDCNGKGNCQYGRRPLTNHQA